MVAGIEMFRNYFEQYAEHYILIGGTACDMVITESGFVPRATKDIDMVLVVEALSIEFALQFWEFVKAGNYEKRQHATEKRQYYRFMKPENIEFPFQVELFSHQPDLFEIPADSHLTPIPVGEEISSLSAILMSDAYYNLLIETSMVKNDLHFASVESLICLKAKAYLDINEVHLQGIGDKKHLRKHKGDIFRLATLLQTDQAVVLPDEIKTDMDAFLNLVKNDLPGNEMYKAMGVSGATSADLLPKIIHCFGLEINENKSILNLTDEIQGE